MIKIHHENADPKDPTSWPDGISLKTCPEEVKPSIQRKADLAVERFVAEARKAGKFVQKRMLDEGNFEYLIGKDPSYKGEFVPASITIPTDRKEQEPAKSREERPQYSVERSGEGWVIFTGRDEEHNGTPLGRLHDCSEGIPEMLEKALNLYSRST